MSVASSSIANSTPRANPSTSRPGIMRWPRPGKSSERRNAARGSTLTRAVSCRISDANERAARRAEVQLDRVPGARRPDTATSGRVGSAVVVRLPGGPGGRHASVAARPSVAGSALERGGSDGSGSGSARPRVPRRDRFEAHAAPRRALVEHGAALRAAPLGVRSTASRPCAGAYPPPRAGPMKRPLAGGLAQPPGQAAGDRRPRVRALHARAPRRPHPPGALGIGEQLGDGVGDLPHVGAVDQQPRLAVDDASRGRRRNRRPRSDARTPTPR